jgi:hypothetical protein
VGRDALASVRGCERKGRHSCDQRVSLDPCEQTPKPGAALLRTHSLRHLQHHLVLLGTGTALYNPTNHLEPTPPQAAAHRSRSAFPAARTQRPWQQPVRWRSCPGASSRWAGVRELALCRRARVTGRSSHTHVCVPRRLTTACDCDVCVVPVQETQRLLTEPGGLGSVGWRAHGQQLHMHARAHGLAAPALRRASCTAALARVSPRCFCSARHQRVPVRGQPAVLQCHDSGPLVLALRR